jgi:hypothetical protein
MVIVRQRNALPHLSEMAATRPDKSPDWPWSEVNQLPSLTPRFFTPLMRRIPAAKSALSSPESAVS